MALEKEFLLETLKIVEKELESRFGRNNNPREKKDSSIVTDADIAAEKLILDRINKYFPDDAIISEESGFHRVSRKEDSYVWIVDPLDGTTNFANSYPFFCSSIGRCKFTSDGKIEPVLGGIVDPIHSKTYIGQVGLGATCNGSKMQVHEGRDLAKAFLVTGFYYSERSSLKKEVERFYRVATSCQSIRRDGASALDLALVANGIYDGFWEEDLSIWDIAAGCLLVTESGGTLSNYPNAINAHSSKTSEVLEYNMESVGLIAGSTKIVHNIHELLR